MHVRIDKLQKEQYALSKDSESLESRIKTLLNEQDAACNLKEANMDLLENDEQEKKEMQTRIAHCETLLAD